MPGAIDVQGLTKRYGDVEVLRGIDLHVDQGEILAFLGPNGAGKTVTIEILEGFRERDGGTVTVLGEDPQIAPRGWREQIGVVLQESEPIPELTAFESVRMQSRYYSSPRDPDEILELVGLTDSRDRRTRKLSGGQKRRLDLAMALVGDPDLIFLDEPTTGFDPTARRESWDMIEALRTLGRTVMLTTHYMDEAQHLADRIVVIGSGEILANGTASDLAAQIEAKTRIGWTFDPDAPAPPSGLDWRQSGDRAVIETDDVVPTLHALMTWATDERVELQDLDVVRPDLEDTYLKLIEAHTNGASR